MNTHYLKSGFKLHNGKYAIDRVLGQGGFGITYKAIMKETISGNIGAIDIDIPVAVKEFFMQESCMRDENTAQVTVPSTGSKATVEQFRRKFVKEAQNLATLSHPNIVKVIDVFSENGTDYYVMEYLEGGSLRELVKKQGKIEEAKALRYISSVGDALNYMHTQKHMCHYDVKPGNILLDKSDNPKLIDFGISKNYDTEGHQTSSTPVGISAGFAPLEQYQQSVAEFSPQTDIYALGATLYYLLTGLVPPEASVVFNNGLPSMGNSISSGVQDAVGQAMQPRKKDRPQTVNDFIYLLAGKTTCSLSKSITPKSTINSSIGLDTDDDEETYYTQKNSAPSLKPSPSIQKEYGIQQRKVPNTDINRKRTPPILYITLAFTIAIVAVLSFVIAKAFDSYQYPNAEPSVQNVTPQQNVTKEVKPIIKEVRNLSFNSGIGNCSYTGPVDDDGVPNGKGIAQFPDGRVYEGSFDHGVMTGLADFMYGNGDTFSGVFVNNAFDSGTYTIKADGSYFYGQFKNGQPNKGTWYDKNGKVIEKL